MRILVPLDGSPLAERAVKPAALLARRSAATLTLLWVDPHRVTQATVSEEFSAEVAANVPDRTPQHLLYLAGVRELPDLNDLDVNILMVVGEPAVMISQIAQEQQMDLIVMATHVLTAFDAAMWGSVTETVARASAVPTLIIRPEGPVFPDLTHANPFTILVPLDETTFAEAALPGAMLLAKACQAEVLLYQVVPSEETEQAQRQRDEDAYRYLNQVAKRLEEQSVPVDRLLGHGSVATSIAAVMLEDRADIVAIATHGQGGFSIAENVLHHVTTPMLLVHPQN
jgi:nucleotide-binding universal stress UspA family protein